MKVIFMGTPDFASGVLRAIIDSNEHEVVAVVTQPDRPKGRSGKMIASPVKELAMQENIPVMTPEKIKAKETVEELRKYDADIFVVAAFGQILSKEILDMPKHGCVNVHASLLPEYRGAAPIQWVIADGKKETGVTIMQMNEGLDTGDIITQCKVLITDTETGESLFNKLMEEGAGLLISTLKLIEEGKATRIPQDESRASYAKILKKDMGKIDFNLSAEEISNRVRAFTPWPGGFSYLNGKMLKIKECHAESEAGEENSQFGNGEIINTSQNELYIKCASGVLVVTRLQLEGKKEMSVHDFLLGYKLEKGTRVGE